MLRVIANIDSYQFWLKLLLANPGDIKPLELFGGVGKVEKKLRKVNEKKTAHQIQYKPSITAKLSAQKG